MTAANNPAARRELARQRQRRPAASSVRAQPQQRQVVRRPPRRQATAKRPTPPPTLAGRLWHFTRALLRHITDLGRRRTPWEIRAIHKICKACPHYIPVQHKPLRWWQRLLRITPSEGACGKCRCNVSAKANKWLNKVAWRSEHCPDDPPRWT